MLRLTVRSGRDGRFLARVIDRDGFAFVLDYGDRRIIQDASQRLLKGFTLLRYGQVVTATPQDADLLSLLADCYAHEGLLVFVEEPTWPGRDYSLEDRLPGWRSGEPADAGPEPLRPLDPAPLGDLDEEDLPTEVAPEPDVDDLGPEDLLTDDLGEEDLATEIAPRPVPTERPS